MEIENTHVRLNVKFLSYYEYLLSHFTLVRFLARTREQANVFKFVLGKAWIVIEPLIAILTYYILIVVLFQRGDVYGSNAFITIMAGIVHFTLFSKSLSGTANSIISSENLLLQVRLEPILFPGVAFFTIQKNQFIMVALYFVCYLWLGPSVGYRIIAYIPLILILMLLTWSCCLLLATLSVFYRDLIPISSVITRLLLYACPVVYTLNFIPAPYQDLYLINPFAAWFSWLHWSMLGAPLPPIHSLLTLVLFALAVFFVSNVIYGHYRERFTKAF